MTQQQTPFAPTSFHWGANRSVHKARALFVFGVFVLTTCLAIVLATPAPLRSDFADVLSGFLSGPTGGWHGETVALTLSPASRVR